MTDQPAEGKPTDSSQGQPGTSTPEITGSVPTGIRSATPKDNGSHINPSAPGNTGTTPGTNAK